MDFWKQMETRSGSVAKDEKARAMDCQDCTIATVAVYKEAKCLKYNITIVFHDPFLLADTAVGHKNEYLLYFILFEIC